MPKQGKLMKKRTKILIISLLLTLTIATVLGAILYSRTNYFNFRVQRHDELELYWSENNGLWIKINPEDGMLFQDIPYRGSRTEYYYVVNKGNAVARIELILPSSTSEYTISTTFNNTNLLRNESYYFTITITDIEMSADKTYMASMILQVVP